MGVPMRLALQAMAIAALSVLSCAQAAVFTITIKDDGFGSEIAWSVNDLSDGSEVDSIPYGTIPDFAFTTTSYDVNLGSGDYEFTIFDFFGDGIVSGGGAFGYALSLDGMVLLDKLGTGYTGFSESFRFSVDDSSSVPVPAGAALFVAGLMFLGRRRRKSLP